MKIIGERPNSVSRVLLVEMDEDEVARLAGFYSRYDAHSKGTHLKPGDEINVNAMYTRLSSLKANVDAVGKVVQTLRSLASDLEPMQPLVSSIILSATPAE